MTFCYRFIIFILISDVMIVRKFVLIVIIKVMSCSKLNCEILFCTFYLQIGIPNVKPHHLKFDRSKSLQPKKKMQEKSITDARQTIILDFVVLVEFASFSKFVICYDFFSLCKYNFTFKHDCIFGILNSFSTGGSPKL